MTELEATNTRVLQELSDFKAESKELRNQDLTIKRLEAQLGQMKAQLQNKVLVLCNCNPRCLKNHSWLHISEWLRQPDMVFLSSSASHLHVLSITGQKAATNSRHCS